MKRRYLGSKSTNHTEDTEAMSSSPSSSSSNKRLRMTRSTTKRQHVEREARAAQSKAAQVELESAQRFLQDPILRGLVQVFQSGFLYKHECRASAVTCRRWSEAWADVKPSNFPSKSLVEVRVVANTNDRPYWAEHLGLIGVFGTQEFAKTVLDKVTELRAASASSERRQAQIRAAQPKWGQDYEGVRVYVWGPNSSNPGGVCLRPCQWRDFSYGILTCHNDVPGFLVRLDTRLRLWTGIRNWSVYNGEALWPHPKDYSDFSDDSNPFLGYSSDSEDE